MPRARGAVRRRRLPPSPTVRKLSDSAFPRNRLRGCGPRGLNPPVDRFRLARVSAIRPCTCHRAHLKTASNNVLFDMSAAPSSPPTGDSYRSKGPCPSLSMADEPFTSTPASPDPAPSRDASGRDRELIERLAFMSLVEQRRARRWNLVLRFAWLALAVSLAVFWFDPWWLEPRTGRPAQRPRRHPRTDRRRGRRQRRGSRCRASGRVRGLRHRGRDPAHQQPGRQPGPGRLHQRRDRPSARAAPGHSRVCGDHRYRRVRRLLRRLRRGRDLRKQVERRRIDRGADGRLRVRGCDEQARRGETPVYRGRAQGPAGSLLAGQGRGDCAPAVPARRCPPRIHRGREAGPRRSTRGGRRHLQRPDLDRLPGHRARPRRCLRQHRLRGARGHRSGGDCRLHHPPFASGRNRGPAWRQHRPARWAPC